MDNMERAEYLSVRTRGNSNAQGKPRVYFCCHPADFEKYFDKVCEDIFKTYDCAIYYTKDMSEPIPEKYREVDLERMNLFVVPVTFKLMTETNRAMDSDIAFAKEKNILILPLMMESGIDVVYALDKNFGKRQYLNPYSSDLTEVKYEEKLKKFLESVLISDELAKRIRAAFDAYIFLSYRKKDRHHANELMKIIHSNPKFRDIAIWYDEFLVPGRDFEGSIRAAMEKSDLFTLLVTPNLVNEPNYVQEHEYPEARTAGKDIIPAEMEQTDKDELQDKFDGIPECVDPYDDEAFCERFVQAVSKIAFSENDDDPEHNYLIGLAYLEGIDVEVNVERGIELITKAGEANYEEAMRKLTSVYKNGEGVERDYFVAIEWQNKILENQRMHWWASESMENGEKYIDELLTLGDLFFDIREYTDAKSNYQEAASIVQKFAYKLKRKNISFFTEHTTYRLKCKNGFFILLLVKIYNKLGIVCMAKVDMSDAERFLAQGYELCNEIVDKTGSIESRRLLASTCKNLGNMYFSNCDIENAQKNYDKACDILEQMRMEIGETEICCELAKIYGNCAAVCKRTGDFDSAEKYYRKAIEIMEQFGGD